ncbi:MAG: phosphatidate cytidylyltransferase [Firmicutes bacterium]|nr:phosphatidate cytidylyltransferase [Bacillota bacterium]MBQ9605098.1 phosphatidate cytidylyltransferase [Bacillota bacterium]
MAVRIISAVVGFFILLAFVLIGGLPVEIGAAGLSLIGMYELYTAVSKKLKPVHFVGFAAEIYYVFGYHYAGLHSAAINLPVIMAAVMLTLVFLVAMHESTDINDVSITWFGFLYVGVLMYCLVLLYKVDKALVWLPLLCAWGSDTFAYFIGIKFGKHKMAPVLSPKKSVEGAVAGVIGAGVLVAVYCSVFAAMGGNKGIFVLVPIGMVAAAFSQIGDLAASAIKRQTGIKDYGNIMPGHGGVLDRFDSVLFTAPTIYILFAAFARFSGFTL